MSPQCAAERNAWREVKDGWRPLYGDVDSMGVAFIFSALVGVLAGLIPAFRAAKLHPIQALRYE